MKLLFTCIVFLMAVTLFAQKEGQLFCEGDSSGSYFPLTIKKKMITWYNSYYTEELAGTKIIDGKEYIVYKQAWKAGNVEDLYVRMSGDQVLQYEDCCEAETVRYDASLKQGAVWTTADKKTNYKVVTYDGILNTPYCSYKDLMVVEANFIDVIFRFYYLNGYGYVGATESGQLVSFVSPK